MATIETYSKTDMTGQTFTFDLNKSEDGRWSVNCWKHVEGEGDTGDSFEHSWQSSGVVVEDDGMRQKRVAHTEETARAEFERWRA